MSIELKKATVKASNLGDATFMRHLSDEPLLGKKTLISAVLAGIFMLTGATHLRADHDDCQRRIAKTDHKLHEAIEHHGYQSRQADHWRHELHEAREHCWNASHRWWDEDGHRWHTDRDWDDHDHDHR